MRRIFLSFISFCFATSILAGEKLNFNASWLLKVGDIKEAQSVNYDDNEWQKITLPYAFNGKEAFAVHISNLTDTVMWYRKHFTLCDEMKGKHLIMEFEGVRQAADIYVNGSSAGLSENGVMAFGIDITPYVHQKGDNVIAVRVDNSWSYRERATQSGFQWNDRNFNANYGGINKNVWMHVTGDIHQTLPLYDNLKTTGTYIYATDFDIQGHKATIHAESEVKNESDKAQRIGFEVEIFDIDGKSIATFSGSDSILPPHSTGMYKALKSVDGLHFWSWGYGYLYDVKTRIMIDGRCVDEVATRTGFRKTEFDKGMVKLNDRTIQLKGFAQRSTNEWPAIGLSVPAWMSDYSNGLALECNANLFRWMHITPWKQDIESFDRLGIIEAMPAGDSEKDSKGRQWEQRKEVMRDAIIYNRNNPSILFYECGNNEISDAHMSEMIAIRNIYDPKDGRAIGSRNMLGSHVAEYGGEMLYVNKSAHKPMWQMEYNRDEGLRKYWDSYSYPFHPEGEGPLYRNAPAPSYNHNQDMLAVENVIRWNEYWTERPGTGTRVNSGGAKIIFSDSNTHQRGEVSYRTSGDVDAMRLPKDSWYVHKAMWDGWVDTEKHHTYIIGHWNCSDTVTKPVYVVSTSSNVELLLNGTSLGKGKRSNTFLFTFDNVKWKPGTLLAISRDDNGKEQSRYQLTTTGKPAALKMHWLEAPETFRADGADVRIAEVEIVDKDGRRCPLANNIIDFTVNGPAEWLGGIALGNGHNYVLDTSLPVECGVNRVMIRSTLKAGSITLKASTKGLRTATLSITTTQQPITNGFYTDASGKIVDADWGHELPCRLTRGETPPTASYRQVKNSITIVNAEAACDTANVSAAYDDNEDTKWTSDGMLSNARITFHLAKKAHINEMVIKLLGFRSASYPLEVYSGNELVYHGCTPKSLGYCHLPLKETFGDTYTIKMTGAVSIKDAFGDMTELAENSKNQKKPSKNNRLSIIEVEFNENAK
jgi:beta-galactosidase